MMVNDESKFTLCDFVLTPEKRTEMRARSAKMVAKNNAQAVEETQAATERQTPPEHSASD
eukprot:CAMPEP_0181474166 /NCGR_PEP_ID=MMETSP1110-20121109/40503_1 /TAXON_ID=174948 /ORGANISM="Symbiodinium sp., Strain CCMP421" /LENGTH=59 /DNA_ID=CAMNT_0023599313 /DNA_START=72 /DNA_END=251 /DNA_ORIENTATION=-